MWLFRGNINIRIFPREYSDIYLRREISPGRLSPWVRARGLFRSDRRPHPGGSRQPLRRERCLSTDATPGSNTAIFIVEQRRLPHRALHSECRPGKVWTENDREKLAFITDQNQHGHHVFPSVPAEKHATSRDSVVFPARESGGVNQEHTTSGPFGKGTLRALEPLSSRFFLRSTGGGDALFHGVLGDCGGCVREGQRDCVRRVVRGEQSESRAERERRTEKPREEGREKRERRAETTREEGRETERGGQRHLRRQGHPPRARDSPAREALL